MSTISKTLIEGLSAPMVSARLNSIDTRPFLYGTHFPLKRIVGFNWRTLQNQIEKINVAADVHTDNGTIVRKRRPLVESANGDLPLIAVAREMSRSEIKDYQTALALAKDSDAAALVQYWGNDVDFCFNAVQAELEYIAWSLVSNAGVLAFNASNNATFATQFNIDYEVDNAQKVYTGTDWNNPNAKIITDLVSIVNTAKQNGFVPKYAFVSLNTFYKIATNEQVMKASAAYSAAALEIAQSPDVASVNAMLARQPWLNGLQLVVVDQTITRELMNGTRTSANPFADDRLVLSETPILGSTQYDILADKSPNVIRAERAHTVVKKYSTIEPTAEITIGQADAIPVLDSAYKNIYVKTDAVAW